MAQNKPKTVRAIPANKGVEARYRQELDKLIKEMIHSFDYWVTAAYRKYPPHMVAHIAQDAAPAKAMEKVLKALGKRWIKKFNELAPKISNMFGDKMLKTSDTAFQDALKAAGWTIEFTMTRTIKDVLDSVIAENVSLIKSIPQQYLNDVQGIVMRSYSRGRDLYTMTEELKSRYGVTQKRAALISRDQSNKANSAIQQARQIEIGITKAVWQHSSAGKTPRPDHVAAAGKEYDVTKGCLISGEYIFPGQLINCRCTSKSILPF